MDTTRKQSYGLKAVLAVMFAIVAALAVSVSLTSAPRAHAADVLTSVGIQASEGEKTVTVGDFQFKFWYDSATKEIHSVSLVKYSGTSTEITVPSTFVYDGKTYPGNKDAIVFIDKSAFAGNQKITKVSIPGKFYSIGDGAFAGCSNLKEASIESGVYSIGNNAFANCPNLKTYYVNGSSISYMDGCGIGTNSSGTTYSGVTVHTTTGSSAVINYVTDVNSTNANKITLVYDSDPYSERTVSVPDAPISGFSTGSTEKQVDQAAAKHSSESDPAGTVFNVLAAKITSVKKNSLTLQWSKAKGASKYVIYGNKCGKKNKMVKRFTVKGKTKKVISKIGKKALKKGTYYKFIVVAFNSKGKVISTSKMVHAATTGGKAGNHKSVKVTKSVSIKKGATKKLNAKPVAQSKKHKVAKHRGIAYESSNTGIATVSSAGVVKGMNPGSCTIYAYAQNGVCAKVKVTVN